MTGELQQVYSQGWAPYWRRSPAGGAALGSVCEKRRWLVRPGTCPPGHPVQARAAV